MHGRWIAVAVAGTLITACASTSHGRHSNFGPAAVGRPGKNCDTAGGCGRKQYYDELARRYYYFDARDGRYYWDNGKPRY